MQDNNKTIYRMKFHDNISIKECVKESKRAYQSELKYVNLHTHTRNHKLNLYPTQSKQ